MDNFRVHQVPSFSYEGALSAEIICIHHTPNPRMQLHWRPVTIINISRELKEKKAEKHGLCSNTHV